jgi:hypothetical protein
LRCAATWRASRSDTTTFATTTPIIFSRSTSRRTNSSNLASEVRRP